MAKDKMRKAYQRELNRHMRSLNKSIEKDDLWMGRFVFLQRECRWTRFEDGSGGELMVCVRAYDKKNGYYKDYVIDYAPWMHSFVWHLSMDIANKFITEDAEVWTAENRPSRENAVDYTGVSVNVQELMKKDWNWFLSYPYWKEAENAGNLSSF